VQALGDPAHPKHNKVISHVQVVVRRKQRTMQSSLMVPAAVRVEAGWDRSAPAWAFLNRMRITDAPLDADQANIAASICHRARVSVADAHIGAVVQASSADAITVLTSDPGDMRQVSGHKAVTIVSI
jgi:predicted nucleic acid-binding protein